MLLLIVSIKIVNFGMDLCRLGLYNKYEGRTEDRATRIEAMNIFVLFIRSMQKKIIEYSEDLSC